MGGLLECEYGNGTVVVLTCGGCAVQTKTKPTVCVWEREKERERCKTWMRKRMSDDVRLLCIIEREK